jgi:RimJ/RimL family protein N-acetyltransferase
MTHDSWPLFGLRVTTPTIELRYVDDELAGRLADLAARGIHDPAYMPFVEPWTDADPALLRPNTMRYFWRCRATTDPRSWHVPFAALDNNQVVGCIALLADDFGVLGRFATGSWLGREHQGRGLGREMREAALHLGFEGLGADSATTCAFADNAASLAVTERVGYRPNGTGVAVRRGTSATLLHFELDRDTWSAVRRNDIAVGGVEACRSLLGTR